MIRTFLDSIGFNSRSGRFVWGTIAFGAIAVVAVSYGVDFEGLLKSLPFSNDPGGEWYYGPVGFVLFSTLAICVSCPRQAVSLVAGFFFGFWPGFFLALFAASFSCAITYGLSCLLRERVSKYVTGKLSIAVDFWRENTFLATLIWRFIPAGSNLLTNLAAGALAIPAWRFVAGSAIGYIPHTLVFASLGSGLQLRSNTQIAISIALFVVAVLVGVFLVKKYQSNLSGKPVSRA